MTGADDARAAPPSTPANGDAESAARLGIVAARAGVRAAAFGIDALIWLILAVPAVIGGVLLAGGDVSWGPLAMLAAGGTLTTIFVLTQLILHGRRGVTAGKASMRLRSVAVADLGRPGFWRIVLRAIVLAGSGVVPVVGPVLLLVSGVWDPQRRGRSILDRIGGCWVIDARAGLDPADARALRRAIRELDLPLRQVSEALPSLSTSGGADRPSLDEPRSRAAVVGAPGGPWSQPPSAEETAGLTDGLITAVPRVEHVLVFEDGSIVPVPEYGLIGRSPESTDGRAADALLTLEDPHKLLSKTHLAFGVDAGGVWIMDRDSSNGTTIVGAGGVETTIAAGSRVGLEPGAVVRLGGRMFQVRRGGTPA